MHLDRIFTICPYLAGSPEGGICRAAATLVRNIEDIDPDMCQQAFRIVLPLYFQAPRDRCHSGFNVN